MRNISPRRVRNENFELDWRHRFTKVGTNGLLLLERVKPKQECCARNEKRACRSTFVRSLLGFEDTPPTTPVWLYADNAPVHNPMKSILRKLLAAMGWELKRIRRPTDLIHRNAHAAIYGDSSLLQVETGACTDKLGFNYERWHPWSETARQLIRCSGTLKYDESVLSEFYEHWEFPIIHDVFAALIRDEKCRNHFLKIFHGEFLPFCNVPAENLGQRIATVTSYLETDNAAAGYSLTADQSVEQNGTWTPRKGEIELKRLAELITSIQRNGYQRSLAPDGDILAYALQREDEFRYVIVSGLHRTAVLSALGYEQITLRLRRNMVVKREDVGSWPLVTHGAYSTRSALAYFDHLFDFDSLNWARVNLDVERND